LISIRRIRTAPGVLSLLACVGCGVLDPDDSEPLTLHVQLERPCARYCVQGGEHELSLSAYDFDGDLVVPIEGVTFKLAASTDALELADTILRTSSVGTAATTLKLLRPEEETTVLITILESSRSVTAGPEWETGLRTTYRILAGPPQVTFDRDSIYIVEPGCEGEVAWTLSAGGAPLTGEGRPRFSIGSSVAHLFAAVDDHTFVEGDAAGRTQLTLAWDDGFERLQAQLPVRVGPFVPRTFSAAGGSLFLGDTTSLTSEVKGACQTRGVTDQTSFTSLTPQALWIDPLRARMVGRELGAASYVGSYGAFTDTADVVVIDYRILPLDTVLHVGESFDFRPERALGDSGYRAWSGDRKGSFYFASYLSYTSSDTAVVAVTEKEAFFAQVRAKAAGKVTITVRMQDHHGWPWGPPRTATVTVVEPD
jgi:hypothetical protein